jgi:hypothetical protein
MTYPALSSGPFKNNKVILVITVEVARWLNGKQSSMREPR